MKAVIMAGGQGTRISSIISDIPKPMIKIGGKPVLEHALVCLRRQGITNIILTVSYLGNVIVDYFGDGNKISPATGKPFGVQIDYFFEKEPLGNAGALYKIKDKLQEDFLLLNADVMFNVDFKRFVSYHKSHNALVTLFTHPNDHPFDSGLIVADENGAVQKWLGKEDKRPTYYHNRVNAGLHIMSPEVLKMEIATAKVDLDSQILKPLTGSRKMFCYDSPEYVKDMGTPERYVSVCTDYKTGKIAAKNLANKQKAIFLDRDGTINIEVGFLHDINDFILLPGAAEAIKKINNSGYLAIVVTNQPVVARGEITLKQLQEIHYKMETLLGQEGAYLDAIYYCPHHPDSGYQGEVTELKCDCKCRKPKPGMLISAEKDFNIDLNMSWVIGDSERDIIAGNAAGCKTAFLGDSRQHFNQNMTVNSLLEFTDKIFR